MARSRRPEKEEPEGEGGVEDGREGDKDEPDEETGRKREKQGSRGAAGLRAILKEEAGKGEEGVKVGRGRSSRLGRRGWSEDGKAYRPGSEMTGRSKKEKKGRGGGGKAGDGERGVKGVGVSCSQSLNGSHSSLGRGSGDPREDCLMAGEDSLMVRRCRIFYV